MSNHNENDEALDPGHIKNLGMLDLRGAKTPEDLQYITRLSNIGSVLIPENLMGAFTRIPKQNIGTVVGIPEGENIKLQSGQLKLSGEMFANGSPDEILLLMGQMFINSPVPSVGYKEVWLYGQGFAIRGSEATLGAKLGRVSGQIFYLPAEARTMMGDTFIDKEFLEYMPEPRALVVMGSLRFADDVTKELLKSKIEEIVLMGSIIAPAELLSLLRVLTVEQMGDIRSSAEAQQSKETEENESDDDTDVQ